MHLGCDTGVAVTAQGRSLRGSLPETSPWTRGHSAGHLGPGHPGPPRPSPQDTHPHTESDAGVSWLPLLPFQSVNPRATLGRGMSGADIGPHQGDLPSHPPRPTPALRPSGVGARSSSPPKGVDTSGPWAGGWGVLGPRDTAQAGHPGAQGGGPVHSLGPGLREAPVLTGRPGKPISPLCPGRPYGPCGEGSMLEGQWGEMT